MAVAPIAAIPRLLILLPAPVAGSHPKLVQKKLKRLTDLDADLEASLPVPGPGPAETESWTETDLTVRRRSSRLREAGAAGTAGAAGAAGAGSVD